MPATSETPSVPLTFANNFWGMDDAGVAPLLERMHNAKATSDELKSFYASRAAIEEDYARKMLSLARRPLGSGETGTLKMSLDVVRQEVESMGKEHQRVAQKMKADLEEPLNAFAGHMKERRKIVQGPIEKLLKIKSQQTAAVNKCRDRYEQESNKVKNYLAQGHMVLGQEERKINAKLEKTKIQVSSTGNEYETAVKALEETTLRWNRDWKQACDTFQDLEEGRIEFTKSSLWAFTNITSTVCVSDDAAWERIRLSLEDCDVQKDISSFINGRGTGQEIPDPPKFKDFCRGDINDETSDDGEEPSYQTAQFPRPINPAHRTGAASPQPPMEGHNDRKVSLASEMPDSSPFTTPKKASPAHDTRSRQGSNNGPYSQKKYSNSWADIPQVPHNEYPPEGMTQLCRTGPPSSAAPSSFAPSDLSSQSARPESRDSISEYSSPSYANINSKSGGQTPQKTEIVPDSIPGHTHQTTPSKKSRFWSPFRRPSRAENNYTEPATSSNQASPNRPASRNTWGASAARAAGLSSSVHGKGDNQRASVFGGNRSVSPDLVEPGAKFQLNVANNVFDVDPHTTTKSGEPHQTTSNRAASDAVSASNSDEPYDPVAAALEDLNRVTSKISKPRDPADKYYDIPSPGGVPTPLVQNITPVQAAKRGTPPPSYDAGSRLGAPPPAHTKSQMLAAQNRYVNQRKKVFESPGSTSQGHSRTHSHIPSSGNLGAASPQPQRPVSRAGAGSGYRPPSSNGFHVDNNNVYGGNTPRARSNTGAVPGSFQPPSRTGTANGFGSSPAREVPSWQSNVPSRPGSARGGPGFDNNMMAVQIHKPGGGDYGRPQSAYYGDAPAGHPAGRTRSRSAVGGAYTKDGRPILHHARAVYSYSPQIPEELGFAKNDVLAVLRLQDDGWWEAEIVNSTRSMVGDRGLVPSNYLVNVDGAGR